MRFIKKTSEYNEIYQAHNKVQGDFFTVLYRLNNDLEEPSAGIVIKSRVGKAVIRNKLKRRIRAYLRQYSAQIESNVSAVIIAKTCAAEAGWEEIKNDLERCFATIGRKN